MTPELNRVYLADHTGKKHPPVLPLWPDNFVDAVVCDPPYELGFMGKGWDSTGIAYSVPLWREVFRVMKPGAHLLAFGGTRTYHRMACAIEDAGFDVRDQIQWLYGQGFPKSLNVSMQLDKMDSVETRRERALRFTGWMKASGLTSRQVNELTASNMGGHYLTDKEQPEVATADMFDKLRPHLPAVPEDIEELVRWRTVESENFKKRQVTGTKMAVDPAKARLGVPGRDEEGRPLRGTKEINLTKAHTELAKKWEGWGTALKPANEPICVARKPLDGTVADNIMSWGTGALNIDAARIEANDDQLQEKYDSVQKAGPRENSIYGTDSRDRAGAAPNEAGRWPANVLLDPYTAGIMDAQEPGASRFFYVAKPAGGERNEGLDGEEATYEHSGPRGHQNNGDGTPRPRPRPRANFHPTVKPVTLMAYLVQLVTPRGRVVLDPFMGSGTTAIAAARLGHPYLGCELSEEYLALAERRIAAETKQGKLL